MYRYGGGGLVLVLMALAGGCKQEQEQQSGPAKPPEVAISQVLSRDVIRSADYTGRADAADSVDIRARVSGYLTAIRFTDGQDVKQGDLLFEIDPRPFQAALDNAQGQKAQWEAKLARAKADVARYEKLVPTGAATPQDLDKARADQGEAAAAIQSADASIEQARLNLEFSKITAPWAGQASKSNFSRGNLIRNDSDLLTTIVSVDPIYINFNVDERALLEFRERARAAAGGAAPDPRNQRIPVTVGLITEQGYPHEGYIDFADNRIDATTGTIRVRAKLANGNRVFKPGLFTRIRVPLGDPFKAILVSDRAIATDQSQKFVYVVDDKNIAQYRPVRLGHLEDDGLRVVADGLKEGECVVVSGLQRTRPGKPVTPQRIEMPRIGATSTSGPAAAGDSAKTGVEVRTTAEKSGQH